MKMKLQWPRIPVPTYRTLRIANYTVAAMAAAMAVTADTHWGALVMAFVCGFNVAAAISCTMQERMKIAFERVCEAFHAMSAVNHQLITGRVRIMMMGDGELGEPTEPSQPPVLH